jgi:hypothetical protein
VNFEMLPYPHLLVVAMGVMLGFALGYIYGQRNRK